MAFPKYLKIASIARTEFADVNRTARVKKQIFEHMDTKFTAILSSILDFSYDLVGPEDGEFGRILPDGQWSGMVGMLQRGKADLIINGLSVTEERVKAIDFSSIYAISKFTFATKKPEHSVNPSSLLKPFAVDVWYIVLVSVLALTVLVAGLSKGGRSRSPHSLLSRPRTAGERMLVACCLVAELFYCSFYAVVLLSFLSFPTLSGVKDVRELAAAVSENTYECSTLPGTYLTEALLGLADPSFRTIGESLNKTEGSHSVETALEVGGHTSKRKAYFHGERILMLFKEKYFVSQDGFFTELIAIGIRKGFCCKRRLDSVVTRVWEAGIYDKLMRDTIFNASRKNAARSPGMKRPLSTGDFEGAFILLVSGYGVAIVLLLCEILVGRIFILEHFSLKEIE